MELRAIYEKTTGGAVVRVYRGQFLEFEAAVAGIEAAEAVLKTRGFLVYGWRMMASGKHRTRSIRELDR